MLISIIVLSMFTFVSCGEDITEESEQSEQKELKVVTADDILSLDSGDYIEITGRDAFIGEEDFNLLVEDSNGEEWYVQSQGLNIDISELEEQYPGIDGKPYDEIDEHKFLITVRGTVNYAGEGAEGIGHPHGVFLDSDAEIVDIFEE